MSEPFEKPPTPTTLEELTTEIQTLLDTVKAMSDGTEEATAEGYNLCTEVMWRSAYMTHEFIAREIGVTGFQHSYSSLKLVGALRNMPGPFMLVDAEQALYPQYVLTEKVSNWLMRDDTLTWLAEEATKKLAELAAQTASYPPASPRVVDHWKVLASYTSPKEKSDGN